jgi:CAAX protease family protein
VQDIVFSFGLWWAAIIIVALLVAATRTAKVNMGWFSTAIIIFALYVTANNISGELVSLSDIIPDAKFNWDGKVAELAFILVALVFLRIITRSIKFSDYGLTLNQSEGSFLPAVIVTVLLVCSMVALTLAFSGPSQADAAEIIETLAFQSTLPGLSEEPLFRGVLLTVLSMAVVSRGVNFLGARIGWGGVLATLLFTVAHGVFWDEGGLQIYADALIVSSFLGFGLLWIRERTGSLVMPIIAHNLINLSSSIGEFAL